MIRSRDFFIPHQCQTLFTNKSGSLADISAEVTAQNKHLIQMEQVHSTDFVFLDEHTAETNKISKVDGVLSSNPLHALCVRTADCLPILLYHPSGIVGALHAGRKSTEGQLLSKVLTFLKEEKNISGDIMLWFGPAICEDCYQIDQDTNTHYSLIAENMRQAYTVFEPEQIAITVEADCTQCLSDEYHSYRVERDRVEMNFSTISIEKS